MSLLQDQYNYNEAYFDVKTDPNLSLSPEIPLKPQSSKMFWDITVISTVIILSLGCFSYYLSLEGCFSKNELDCLTEVYNQENFARLMSYVIIAGILFSIILIFKYLDILSWKIVFLEIALLVLICFYDSGNDLQHHGAYNQILLFIIIFIIILALCFLNSIFKFLSHFKCVLFYPILLLVGSIGISAFYQAEFGGSCSYWLQGFKNSTVNNEISCKLEPPTLCLELILNKKLDLSYYLQDTCVTRPNNDKKIIAQYTSISNPTVIGYPRVEKWKFEESSLFFKYPKTVLKNLIDMKNQSINSVLKENIEVTVNFEVDPPKVDINLKRNETLAQERKILHEKNKDKTIAKNFLVVFLDSLSRNNMKIKLPKFYKYIEKYYGETDFHYESFQFLKYHGTGDTTNPNLSPFFSGVDWLKAKGESVTKFYKKNGYITATIYNECVRELLNLYGKNQKNFGWEASDHEFNDLFCDPNFIRPDNRFALFNGPYSPRIKCLYNKPTFEYVVNYTNLFWDAYKNEPKFVRMGNINPHEVTAEVIKYDENYYLEFFENFEKNGYLNETIVIIFSDHARTHPMIQGEDHKKELYLPFLSIIVPKKLEKYEEIRKKLKNFENRLVTPYDMEISLLDFISEKSSYNFIGRSIIKENQKEDEFNCERYGIKKFCKCN